MKKIKFIAIILSCLLLTLNVSEAAFMTFEGLNEVEFIKARGLEFKDAKSGDIIKYITPGQEVTASVKVRKNNSRFQKVSLVLTVTSNGEQVASTTDYLDISDGGEYTLENSVIIPEMTGLELCAYVWDGINTTVPLASKGIMSSNNAGVECIYIDGQKLKNFNPTNREYTITLDSAYTDYPVVALKTSDLSANVKIKELYSFSSSVKQIEATVVSGSGNFSSTYYLTFVQEEAKISDVKLNGVTGTIEESEMVAPSWNENPPSKMPVNGTTEAAYTLKNLPSQKTKIYNNSEQYYINISPELIGAKTLAMSETLSNLSGATSKSNTKLVSFNLNHSADVYINTLGYTDFNHLEDFGFSYAGILAYRVVPKSSSASYFAVNFYKRSYNVEKGGQVTVELPYTLAKAMYSVVIKYKDESAVLDAHYINSAGEKTPVNTTTLYEPVAPFGKPSATTNMLFGSKVFTDKNYAPKDFFEFMNGAEALVLPYSLNNTKSISFNLKRTSSVYFVWSDTSENSVDAMPYLSEEGYMRYSKTVKYKMVCDDKTIQYPQNGGIFKKEYYLEPGESKTITFDNISSTDTGSCMIFICDISYDYFDKEGCIELGPDDSLMLEAEDPRALVNKPFTIRSIKGQDSVWITNEIGSNGKEPVFLTEQALRYPIAVEKSGKAYIWFKIYSPHDGADSFYIGIDEKTPTHVTPSISSDWHWMLVKSEYLTRGLHHINIYHREAGVAFDKIMISTDVGYLPEDYTYKHSVYDAGDIVPKSGEHPRLLINKEKIPYIKSNLTHPQNKETYEKLIEMAEYNTNGYLTDEFTTADTNADIEVHAAAFSNAFLYAVNNDKKAGEKAVRIFENMTNTLSVVGSNNTYFSRMIGNALFSCAIVYDWCYDLIDSEMKEKFISLFYYMASQLETGWPPVMLYTVSGHALEGELLKDYLSVGVAVYDEEPEIYNNVAGRVLDEIVPVKNYYSTSMQLFEGATYGQYREFFTMMSAYIFDALGYENIYKDVANTMYGIFYNRKPDGRFVSTGDNAGEASWGFASGFDSALFMVANYYKDPYLKREYFRGSNQGASLNLTAGGINPLIHLIVNDVSVEPDKSFREFPLTVFYNYPSGILSARTSWDEGADSDTLHVQMNIQEQYYGGHQHRDSGHFDIYYKGTLALDSGLYESLPWTDANGNEITDLAAGSLHHMNYHRRTIAHNCMLVYDPDEELHRNFITHDGGQTKNYYTYYKEQLTDGTSDVGDVISYDFGKDVYEPEYSYLKGNLSEGYSDKISDYTRSFMFLNFKDESYPGALIVYDNVTGAASKSDSNYSDFKKTWLLHTTEEPKINGTRTTVTATTLPENNGRLINDTLLPKNAGITNVGGEGNEFTVEGVNFTAIGKSEYVESGKWRLEVTSPLVNGNYYNKNEEFLNVMQISENDDAITPLEVTHITSVNGYNGIRIKNYVVYLKRTSELTSDKIILESTDSSYTQIVDGLSEGVWKITEKSGKLIEEVDVFKGHNTLSFKAPAGTYVLERISENTTALKDYSLKGRIRPVSNQLIDIKINNIYETFKTGEPYIENNKLYLPAEELAIKTGNPYSYSNGFMRFNNVGVPSEYIDEKENILYIDISNLYTLVNIEFIWNKYSNVVFIK